MTDNATTRLDDDPVSDEDVLDADHSDDVASLLLRDDGFVWVDVPQWYDEAPSFLAGLGCHALVIEACSRRNHVPTVHSCSDHYFVTMHASLEGANGQVHLLELDQIVGDRFLVTVHGPMNPAVDPSEALVETAAVRDRIEGAVSSRRSRPSCRTPSRRPWPGGSAASSGWWPRSCPAWSST